MSSANEGCLLAFLRAFGINPQSQSWHQPGSAFDFDEESLEAEIVEDLPYRVRDDFLSPAERHFFLALVEAVGSNAIVCPKVRLGDILFSTDRTQFWKHTNRVNQKHVDFLLCSRAEIKPLVAIELDDQTHQREKVKARDRFKDAAFLAAGLPLVRITTRRSYEREKILDAIGPYLATSENAGPVPFASIADARQPTCSKCGVPMVMRTASRGQQAGQRFFGCPNFPKCREILQLSDG